MKRYILLLLLSAQSAYAMEGGDLTKTGILTRMNEVRDNGHSPAPWRNRKDLQQVRSMVTVYCSSDRGSIKESLPALIKAAQETRLDRQIREQKLATFSKAKITVGSIFALFAVGQIAVIVTSWSQDDCSAAYDRLFNALGSISSGIGGGYMIYDGISNSDAKLESLEACKTELLLLQKYVQTQFHPEPSSGYTSDRESKTEE